MQTFEIPEAPLSVSLTPDGPSDGQNPGVVQAPFTGSLKFSVNNKMSHGVSGRASVQPMGDAKAEWFSIEGEAQRQFHASGSHVYTVRLRVPPGTPPGRHSFRLRVVNVNETDNDFAESSVAGFDVPSSQPAKKIPWWILAVVLGVLLLVGAVALVIWKMSDGEEIAVPNLVEEPSDCREVVERFKEQLTVICEAAAESQGKPAWTVLGQTPEPGQMLEHGATLTLVHEPGIMMPSLVTVAVAHATEQLSAMGLEAEWREIAPSELGGRALNTVLVQSPEPGTPLDQDSSITLEYVKGVELVNYAGWDLTAALTDLHNKRLGFSEPQASVTRNLALNGKVIGQDLAANTLVVEGTRVSLSYHKHTTAPPCRIRRGGRQIELINCQIVAAGVDTALFPRRVVLPAGQ